MDTIEELIRDRADDGRTGLLSADRSWTHAEVVAAQAQRAAVLTDLRRDGPFHIALLLDNVPEYVFWMGAAALVGAVVVGANPTHRGDELARDLSHTECQLLVTDGSLLGLVRGHDLGPALPSDRIVVVDSPDGDLTGGGAGPGASAYGRLLAPAAGSPLPDRAGAGVTGTPSGTSCSPRARRAHPRRACARRVAWPASAGRWPSFSDSTADDVCYMAMPLFHSNALMTAWAPALAAGATAALRDRFSASHFLPDVRRYGATYFNYVGKPLSYILATPEHPDDADNPLRRAFGNEAAEHDVARFAARFGCHVQDAYGSTEGGAAITRTPDTPRGALGRALPGTRILDPDTGHECPRAAFDDHGRLVNAEEAIGEIVSTTGGAGFEGYWHNDEAERARLRNGWYWTGDLGYRSDDDFFYFAGRDVDWLRVDGENFAAAPVEAIIQRHPDVVLVSVYAVPDTVVGDQVMAAVQLADGATFDPAGFAAFLAAQDDLGTKAAPKYVRVTAELPVTATSKVLKRVLRNEGWRADDPIWWRSGRGDGYRLLTPADADALDEAVLSR